MDDARTSRTAANPDGQPVEDHNRRDPRRYARFLRLFSDRVCARLYCRRLAPDLRPVGLDPAVGRHRRHPRRLFLGLDGRQDRPAQGVYRHRAQLLDRHRHHGADPGQGRLDLSLGLSLFRRRGCCGPGRRRSAAGAGIRALVKARLDRRAGDQHRFGGRDAGRGVGRLSRTAYRLARAVCRRLAAGAVYLGDPRLGSRIAALADPQGTARGCAPVDRLGVGGRSGDDRIAGNPARNAAHAVARAVQIPAQHGADRADRPVADERGSGSRCGRRHCSS